MEKKISYQDIQSATKEELKKTYKINQRQVEQAIRKNMEGANRSELESFYRDFYDRK